MDYKEQTRINKYILNANHTTATTANTSGSAKPAIPSTSFDAELELAKRATQMKQVDAALVSLKSAGEAGINMNSKLAYDLGLLTSVSSPTVNSSVNSSTANGSAASTSANTSASTSTELPINVSKHTTTKCPSHSGSTGYENTGTLKCSSELQKYFEEAAKATGVDIKLLKAVAYRESNFKPNETSSAGAKGVMQIMPCNCEDYGVTDAYDPRQNILAGACELADYLNKYDGNLELSLAAYNTGAGNVKKYGGVPSYCNRYINDIKKLYNS